MCVGVCLCVCVWACVCVCVCIVDARVCFCVYAGLFLFCAASVVCALRVGPMHEARGIRRKSGAVAT